MPRLHAYDCRCGTRNDPVFGHCRRCGAPQSAGRPLWDNDTPPRPVPALPRRQAETPFWAWAINATLLLVLSFFAWPLMLVGLFFFLVYRIAIGVWCVANRLPPH